LKCRFHGIGSWAPDKFKNSGSEHIGVVETEPYGPQLVVLAEPETEFIPESDLDPKPNLDPELYLDPEPDLAPDPT
jgi:hypothetical protein